MFALTVITLVLWLIVVALIATAAVMIRKQRTFDAQVSAAVAVLVDAPPLTF